MGAQDQIEPGATGRRRITYNALLWCMIALQLVAPFAHHLGGGERVLNVGFAVVLIAAIKEEARTRRRLVAALVLGVPAIAGRVLAAAVEEPPLLAVVAIFAANVVFFGYIIHHVLHDVMGAGRVTSDTLRGAICAYLLIGMAWWLGFAFLEYLQPGSFSIPAAMSGSVAEVLDSLYYFSFVTLTTLGYGDITPVSHFARTLVMLEAIVGQLYIAIMIARLVGLQAAQRRDE